MIFKFRYKFRRKIHEDFHNRFRLFFQVIEIDFEEGHFELSFCGVPVCIAFSSDSRATFCMFKVEGEMYITTSSLF